MQDLAAERDFYDSLFERNPNNEHITGGYDELYRLALPDEADGVALDVGCGTGAHAVRLARRGYRIVALDLSPQGIRAARARFQQEGLAGLFVVANAEALPFREGTADLTWTSLLLHHFPQLGNLPAELARVTRKRIVAFEPNAGNLLTWLAMNVVNRLWRIRAMTANQVALRPGRLRRRLEKEGFRQAALHYVHRPWADGMGFVRRAYSFLTAWLPKSVQANKFLVVFERSGA